MLSQMAAPGAGLGWQQLGTLLAGRLVFNTAFRVVYPLLPLLAAGLGVELGVASLLVTAQVAASLLSPLGGAITDRFGERATLLAGLALFTLGAAGCALAPSFWPFLAGYGLIGLGTALYMPAVQTYASNRSDYSRRGRVLGLLELSWAASAFVGVVGLVRLIEAAGGWAPAFWALAGLGAAMLALHARLPEEARRPGVPDMGEPGGREGAGPRARSGGIREALAQPGVAATLGVVFLQLLAVELVFVVYGTWLEGDFGASTEQLGLVFGLLGLFELGGSVGATLLTDRLGKRRAVLAGFAAMGALLLLLPLSAGRWGLFLALFMAFALCFEFAVVSVFPLISGMAARARGSVMALCLMAIGVGRIVGSVVGPRLFEATGFWGNGLLAGAAALAGVALGAALIREGRA
ncbi:MAG TPA: MFS transporter [Chloroflexaceae bacterium]|nr:MFS transporter [Chloroflexaceae bacterium]